MRLGSQVEMRSFFNVDLDVYDPEWGFYSQWKSGTNYTIGDRVIARIVDGSFEHWVRCEALTNHTNKDPNTVGFGEFWEYVGEDGIWQIFDKITQGQSTAGNANGLGQVFGAIWEATASSVEYLSFTHVDSGLDDIDTICLFNVDPDQECRIEVWNPEGELVYSKSKFAVFGNDVLDWFDYFTAPLANPVTLFRDIPFYDGNELRVYGRFQEIVGCREWNLGNTEFGSDSDFENLSVYSRDEFNNISITERETFDVTKFKFSYLTSRANFIKRLLQAHSSQFVLLYSDEEDDDYGLTTYGFIKDSNIPTEELNVSTGTIEIEGT